MLPRISADGRYVIFESMAKLVDTDTDTNRDIYFRDLQTGALTRVSTEANGDQDSGSSQMPKSAMMADLWSSPTHLRLLPMPRTVKPTLMVGPLE